MRKERNKSWKISSNFNNIKYDFFYKRNFYGFRGEEFDPINVKIIFEANKIPRNEAYPFPPFKFSIHTGKIWPSKIIVADKIIRSALIIEQIDIAI